MRERGSRSGSHGEPAEITLAGTPDEIDLIRRMLTGACWLRGEETGLSATNAYLPLPTPEDDPLLPPRWSLPPLPPIGMATEKDLAERERARENLPKPPVNVGPPISPSEGWHMPSFWVQHLGAGDSLAEAYRRAARTLTAVGFECMRSRRGKDGKIWEGWYLPGIWSARGRLKEALANLSKDATWDQQGQAVVEWLCHNVAFGCADMSVQRAALTFD